MHIRNRFASGGTQPYHGENSGTQEGRALSRLRSPSTTESLYCPRCGANMKKSAQTRSASETSSWSAQSPGSEPKSESSASQEGADQTTTQ
jgi:PHP family Zn ribbon phosphoesterase